MNIDGDQQEEKEIKIQTKIQSIKNNYCFHDQLNSSSGFSNHYIVEDMQAEVDQTDENNTKNFYYLKQTVFSNKKEYLYAKSYAQKLQQCSNSLLCKNYMIKFHFIHNFEDDKSNYYELIQVIDLGEPDRIILDQIEKEHINKFLRNICNLLNNIRQFDDLYHSNIELQNIVLINMELKISGFKPRFILNEEYRSWKMDMIREFGHHRLDLFMIGVLWLKFLRIPNIELIERESQSMFEILKKVKTIVENESIDHNPEMIRKLLDVYNFPNLIIDDVLLSFDENAVIEGRNNSILQEIRESQVKNESVKDQKNNERSDEEIHNVNKVVNDFEPQRYSNFEVRMLRPSESKESNVFFKDFKEQEMDGSVREQNYNCYDFNQVLHLEDINTLGGNDFDKKYDETEQNYIEVEDGKSMKLVTDGTDRKRFGSALGTLSHKQLIVESFDKNESHSMRKRLSNQNFAQVSNPLQVLEEKIMKISKKQTLGEIEEMSEMFPNEEKEIPVKPLSKDSISSKTKQIVEDEPIKFDEFIKKRDSKSENTNNTVKKESKNKIKIEEKSPKQKKDTHIEERDKLEKIKIDKKLKQNLEKRKDKKNEMSGHKNQNEFVKSNSESKKKQSENSDSKKDDDVVKATLEKLLAKGNKNTSNDQSNYTDDLNERVSKDEMYNESNELKTKENQSLTKQSQHKELPNPLFVEEIDTPLFENHIDKEEKNSVLAYFSNQQDLINETFNFITGKSNQMNQGNSLSDSGLFIKAEILESQFKKSLGMIKTLLMEHNYTECLQVLSQFKSLENPNSSIDLLKLTSLVYFKNKQYQESKLELIKALKMLQTSEDISNPQECLQSVLISVALVEFELKNYEDVVEILQNKIFENTQNLSKDFHLLLAQSFFELEFFKAAFFNYDKCLQLLMENDLHPKDLKEVQSIAEKIIVCLSKINETDVILKFVEMMTDVLNKYKPTFLKKEQKKNHQNENFLFSTLKILISLKNESQIKNYLLFLHQKQIVLSLNQMNKVETDLFVIVSTSHMLKSSQEERKHWMKAAKYFANYHQNINDRNESLFLIYFTKAKLIAKEKDYSKLLKLFEKILEFDLDQNSKYLQKLYYVFYNIGICNWHLGRTDEASFYFDKAMVDSFIDQKTEMKILKILCKIYFELKIYENCKMILNDLIVSHFDKQSFFKYMIMYFICCEQDNFKDLDSYFFDLFEKKLLECKDSDLSMIGFVLLIKKHLSSNEMKKANQLLNDEKFENLFSRSREEFLLFELNKLKAKLISNLFGEALLLATKIQTSLIETDDKSEKELINFLSNLRYFLIQKNETNENNIEEKISEINEILYTKEQACVHDDLYTVLKEQSDTIRSITFDSKTENLNFTELNEDSKDFFSDVKKSDKTIENQHQTEPSKREQADKVRNELYKNLRKKEIPKQTESIDLPSNKSIESDAKLSLKRMRSSEILQRSNLKKVKCCCFEFNRKNADIVKLVKEFMVEIKQSSNEQNSFAKSVVDLKEQVNKKKLRFLKFSYIKKLSKIVFKHQSKETVNYSLLSTDFEELLCDKEICIHDIRKIISMLEASSSSKLNFVEWFIHYLDAQHKSLLNTVLSNFIVSSLNKEYSETIVKCYDQLYHNPDFYFKDFALMHYLDVKKFDKPSTSNLLKRNKLRFEFVEDQTNYFICSNYLSKKDLISIYLSSAIKTFIRGIEKNIEKEETLLSNLKVSFQNISNTYSLKEFGQRFLIYEIFALIMLLKNIESESVVEKLFDLLIYCESKTLIRDLYHFSIVCSLIGNLFVYHKLYDHCLKIKHISHICLKKITEVEMAFPVYFSQVQPSSLMFSILSFTIIANLELERIDKAKGVLTKIRTIKFEKPELELEKQLIFAFFETLHGKPEDARENLEDFFKDLEKISVSKKLKEMFLQISSKLKSLIE